MSSKATIPILASRLNKKFNLGQIDALHGFIFANGKLWGCAQMQPCRIVRLDLDMVTFSIATCSSDGQHDRGLDIVYDSNINGEVFVLHRNTDRTAISRVNMSTMGLSDAVNDTNHPNTNGSMCVTNTHLFCGTNFGSVGDHTAPDAQILKFDLDDFLIKTVATLTGYKQCHAIRFDGTNIYATGSTSTDDSPWIARINPTTLAYTVEKLPQGIGVPTDDFCFFGDYIYLGMELGYIGTLLRVAKSDLSDTTIVARGLPASNFYGTFATATHVWAATWNVDDHAKVIRIDPTTLEQRLYTFNEGEALEGNVGGVNEIVTDGTYLYMTFWQSGVQVNRLQIPNT